MITKSIRQSIKSKPFWLSILSIIFSSIITLYVNKDAISEISVGYFDLFYYSFISGNFILNSIFPVFSIASVYHILTRENRYFRIRKDILNISIISCLIYLVSFSIMLSIFSLFSIHSDNSFSLIGIYQSLCNGSRNLFIVYFVLNTFLLSITYSLLSYAIKYKAKYMNCNYIIIPIIIYNAFLFNPNLIITRNIIDFVPTYSYDVEIGRTPLSHFISIGLVIAIAIIILLYKEYAINKKTCCEKW